jgi:hypothetical protein
LFLEPINTVHGMYKTDNEPIRLSYHCGVHYNSVIDPWRPTAGHGLGLPDLEPGVCLSKNRRNVLLLFLFILACPRITYTNSSTTIRRKSFRTCHA